MYYARLQDAMAAQKKYGGVLRYDQIRKMYYLAPF